MYLKQTVIHNCSFLIDEKPRADYPGFVFDIKIKLEIKDRCRVENQ